MYYRVLFYTILYVTLLYHTILRGSLNNQAIEQSTLFFDWRSLTSKRKTERGFEMYPKSQTNITFQCLLIMFWQGAAGDSARGMESRYFQKGGLAKCRTRYFFQPAFFYRTGSCRQQPETGNQKLETGIRKPETWNWKPEIEIRKPETEIWRPETGNKKPETENHKPETGKHKPETRNHKPETRNRKPENGIRKPETWNWKPEFGIRKTETGIW